MNPILWFFTGMGAILGLIGLWAWFKVNMTYRIGRSSFRVSLFGWTLRRIPFDEIERVDKPHRELKWGDTENWRNTFDDSRRLLVLHRKRGWFRKFVISPERRYEFRRDLREAISEITGERVEEDDDMVGEVEGDTERTEKSIVIERSAGTRARTQD